MINNFEVHTGLWAFNLKQSTLALSMNLFLHVVKEYILRIYCNISMMDRCLPLSVPMSAKGKKLSFE